MSNEKQIWKKLEKIKRFIKDSMFVDGSVNFIANHSFMLNGIEVAGGIFECNDSKRGTFYIGWYKEDIK